MAPYLGDYTEDATLDFMWDSNDADGASITRATDGTVSVYSANSTTQSVAGVTDTEDFDSLTGIHHCRIDLSADAFYAVANDYMVVLSAATIDGQTVNAVLAHFSIENRFAEVDVTSWNGTAVGAPDTAGYPVVTIRDGTGQGELNITSGVVDANTTQIEGSDATDQIDARLAAIGLDHLLAAAVVGADVTDNSVIAQLVSASATADWDDFDNTADSLEALQVLIAAITVGALADAVWDEPTAGHTTPGTFGPIFNSDTIADAVWDEVIEAGNPATVQTARQIIRVLMAFAAGVTAGEGDWSALSPDGVTTRIVASLNATGARTAVTTLTGN